MIGPLFVASFFGAFFGAIAGIMFLGWMIERGGGEP